jgi:CubicO group peptidase (beta-lactamase class C family)
MIRSLVFALLMTFGVYNVNEKPLKMDNDKTKKIEKIAKQHKVIGMALYVINGNNKFKHLFGLRNLKKSLPVTEKTLFRVASISKTVTAIAVMQLVERKKIDLDADINNYLKEKIKHNYFPQDFITSRMLLSHTSSIYDGKDYDRFLTRVYNSEFVPPLSELLVEESSIWINKKPATYFTYCNLNYGILATIIENVSGERFDKYVEKHILKPLNISGGYNVTSIKEKGQISVLYRGTIPQADNYENSCPVEKEYPIGINGLYYSPQGGLRISVTDLAKILQLFMNKGSYNGIEILQLKTVEQMEKIHWKSNGSNGDTNHNLFLSWGLGLQTTTHTKSGDYIMPNLSFTGHIGDAYGLIADMYYNREKNIGLLFISNGTFNTKGYSTGTISSYSKLEEDIFKFIDNEFVNK